MRFPLFLGAVTVLFAAALTGCMAPANTVKEAPRATYSARCFGNDYQGCYDAARDKCKATEGFRVFAKKNNTIGKEIMYSCILDR